MPGSSVYIAKASFRLPSVSNWVEFAALKTSSNSPITLIDSDFWHSRNIVIPDDYDKLYGGIVESPFFADLSQLGIGQNEWSCLDPQQRLCLSLAQELLNDLTLPQNTSVFIGASDTGWSHHNSLPPDNRYLLAGSHLSMISARISYHFDLTAKSKTIDTSCSSALVAISEAVESILSGDSELSICGGVNLFNDPFKFDQLNRMQMLSPDHRCFTFKQNANGYVRSEGGVLFLLASENSLDRYNLTPLAKINGCFVNHDGLSAGITAPSLQSQISLHQHSLRTAGLLSSDIGYIECHGTGTPLGDPIELKALDSVFCTESVFVGSIKSKVGHLEAAAGAVGVLNCLSLFQDLRFAQVDTSPSTKKFTFSDSFLIHSDDNSIFSNSETFSKAAIVSSFGFSGTNSSLILSPSLLVNSSSRPYIALFPGQGKFKPDLGIYEYKTSSVYRHSADSYWERLCLILSSYSVDFPLTFSDRSYRITHLFQQYITLIHLLSLYDFSIHEGSKYDYLIGYSFGEFAASVAGNSLSFDDCIRVLYHREELVEPQRGLFHLYYIERTHLNKSLLDQFFPKEVIVCSPESSIYAISSIFFDQIKSSPFSDVLKYVGVDYCYHSSILIDKSRLGEAFTCIKLDFEDSSFLPSWDYSRSLDFSWSSHFLDPLNFQELLSRVAGLSSSSIHLIEISSKPSLKHIVDQNLTSIAEYSSLGQIVESKIVQNSSTSPQSSIEDLSAISLFILDFISRCSGLDISSIDRSKTFTRCGLDSLELAQLVSKLSSNFSITFSLEELVGGFHVIEDAIQEALRRSSSIIDYHDPVSSPPSYSASQFSSPQSSLQSQFEISLPLQKSSREEIVHSVFLRDILFGQLKESRSFRDSFSSLADPRYSAGYSPLYRDYQVPVVADSASGAHITTVDGHKYLDFTMGFGVQLFGHNPPFIRQCLLDSIDNNSFFVGPQSQFASINAKLLCDLTGHDRALFCNTGTEAVMSAVRLSRAFTKRSKILIFNGSYHGHNDFTLASQSDLEGHTNPSSFGTPPSFLSDTLITDYDDLDSIQSIVQANHRDLAAIIVEPIQSRKPSVDVVTTLRLLRKLCDDHHIVLIFDEVLIGFRCHYQSSFGYFAVKSDISTYGKIIGGGLPIGAVAGNANILDFIDGGAWYTLNEDPADKRIFFAGTFNKNPLTMVCCHKILQYFIKDKGSLQVTLNILTRRLCTRLNQYFIGKGVQIRVSFASSLFRFTGAPSAFYLELLCRNIYIWEGRTCFLSAEHSVSDLQYFESSVYASIESLLSYGVLDSPNFTHDDTYLLTHTQLSLCASYSNLPFESQSFNQLVTISFANSIEFPAFFEKAVTQIQSEISLFGVYDLITSSFTPRSSSNLDWIFYYNNESFQFSDFHPSESCHVQCAVIFNNNSVKELHFLFAHYAIDGKGLNDLFLGIINTSPDLALPTVELAHPVDITEYLLSLLTAEHFGYLERGSLVKRFDLKITSALRLQLVAIAEKYSVTLPTILLSFYINSIQSQLSLKSLVVALFGTTSSSPSEAYLYSSFISPVPLILSSFLNFNPTDLSCLQRSLSKLVLNASVDSSSIASHFNISSSSAHYPLSSFAFNYDKVSSSFSNSNFNILFNKFTPVFPRWNLFLNVVDNLDFLSISLDYNPQLFEDSLINDVTNSFLNACNNFTPQLEDFQPFIPLDSSPPIYQYVSDVDSFTPDNYLLTLAHDLSSHVISSDSRHLTTNDLHRKITNYSAFLSQHPDPLFCIRAIDIVDQLVCILACWNTGRAYILWNHLESFDTNISRLANCGVESVIVFDHSEFSIDTISHDSCSPYSCDLFDCLAHLIYTSGSTGVPKAVPVSIHHLASYQLSISERIPISYDSKTYRFGVLSSLNYDFPFTTILLWLKHGGELFLADHQSVRSPVFWSSIPANFFSFLKILPPFFSVLSEFVPMEKLVPTDVVVFGGDKLNNTLAHQCFSVRDKVNVFTHYGPTETCIGCSSYLIPRDLPLDGISPVGAVLNGYEILVDPIPEGIYEQDPSISYPSPIGLITICTQNTYGRYFDGTAESFLHLDSSVSYKTGDVGYLHNGVLSILGRVSGFLKINGHRVYLSDICLRIAKIYPGLTFHLLSVPKFSSPSTPFTPSSPSTQSDQFVLFYVHLSLSHKQIENGLRDSLPAHFCPQSIFHIPSLPLTSNGKIDTSALLLQLSNQSILTAQNSDCNSDNSTFVTEFLKCCSIIFPSSSLSLASNFFQLGGDSLTAIRLSASFHRCGVYVSSELILTHPEFSDLFSLYLSSISSNKLSAVDSYQYFLTPSQSFFLRYFNPHSWYLTFLVDCASNSSFVDDIYHAVIDSNIMAFSFNSSGFIESSNPSSIRILDRSYSSISSFYSDLTSLADFAVTRLNPVNSINSCIIRVAIKDEDSVFCLLAFPHFLIDFISMQSILDSLSLPNSQYSLGFPISSFNPPLDIPSHFKQIQNCKHLFVADPDFRSSFPSGSFQLHEFILDISSSCFISSSGYSSQILPYLIASVSSTLSCDLYPYPLIDLEFASRDYTNISCSSSIGYFSIHLPCLFEDLNITSLSARLVDIQSNSASLFSYFSTYPDIVPQIPICSINCMDSSTTNKPLGPTVLRHSLSSDEFFPISWSPLMLEAECSFSKVKLKFYFDNKLVTMSSVLQVISHLKLNLSNTASLSDDESTDIINRLGW